MTQLIIRPQDAAFLEDTNKQLRDELSVMTHRAQRAEEAERALRHRAARAENEAKWLRKENEILRRTLTQSSLSEAS